MESEESHDIYLKKRYPRGEGGISFIKGTNQGYSKVLTTPGIARSPLQLIQ